MLVLLIGYTGPGAGLTMLGSLLAVLALVLLALLAPLVFILRLIVRLFTIKKAESGSLETSLETDSALASTSALQVSAPQQSGRPA